MYEIKLICTFAANLKEGPKKPLLLFESGREYCTIQERTMDTVLEKIKTFTEALIEDSSLFLVECFIKPTNNVKVYLDGDNGISIDAISKINKALYKKLESAALFPDGDFSLEVSSPGIGKPLKLQRQYFKNIGRTVRVLLSDQSEINGILKGIESDHILVAEKPVKKKKGQESKEWTIPFEQIKSTTVELEF